MKNKRIIYIFLSIVACFGVVFANFSFNSDINAQENIVTNNTNSLLTYVNPNYGIEIKYPQQWSKNETDINPQDRVTNIVSFLSPLEDSKDTWHEGFDIYFDKVAYLADLAEYLDETITAYEKYKDFGIISQNTHSNLSGLPAYELVYTYTFEEEGSDDRQIKGYEIGTILNNTDVYYIAFEAVENQYDGYFPVVKQSITSFKIGTTSDDEPISYSKDQYPPILENTSRSDRSFQNYSNPQVGINFLSYPDTYELIDHTKEPGFQSDNYGGVILLEIVSPFVSGLDDQQEYMQMGVVEYATSLSMEDSKTYVDEYLTTASENPSFELIESQYSDLIDGFDTYKATYKSFDYDQQVPLKVTLYAVPINDKMYTISYVTNPQQYDKYIPIFDTIVNSIDLTEPKSLISSDEFRSTTSSFNEREYIELSLDEWRSNNIDVIILVNQDTQNQSSKYVNVATEAVQEWSNLLKQYSNNSEVWNFNPKIAVGNLETVQPTNPNTIILELVSTPLDYNYCDEMLGFATPHPTAVNKPVVATILTSCSDGYEILDLPLEDVYSTVSHEFAHTLGLGHAFNIEYDLMCSYDVYPNGEEKETCSNYETTGKFHPSEYDVKALLYKYGNDGFSAPNRDLFEEGGGLRPVFKITDNMNNLSYVQTDLGSTEGVNNINDHIQYNTTIQTLQTGIRLNPEVYDHYDIGMNLLEEGNYSQAIQKFDDVLKIEPNVTLAYIQKGIAYDMMGDSESAFLNFDKALEIDPTNSDALREKGYTMMNIENYEEALSYFDRAIQNNPNDSLAFNNKGFILSDQEKFEDALDSYNRGLEITPEDVTLLTNKVTVLIQLDNVSEALITNDKILQLDPNNKDAIYVKSSFK